MSVSNEQKSIMDKIKEELKLVEEWTGINSTLIMSGLGFCLFFVFIGYFDFYITTIVGIVYPAIWSIRAIESKGSDDDKQWLTYWVVFAIFTFVDLFSGFILKFIPFYFFFKLIFLVWCFMPNTQGAKFIYDKFIVKLYKKYDAQIQMLDEAIDQVSGMINKGQEIIKDNQQNIIDAGFGVIKEVQKKNS